MTPADGPPTDYRDLLLELSLLISERRGVDEIFAAFADHVRHGITFDFTSLFVVTDDPGYIRAVGHYPPIDVQSPPGTIHRVREVGSDRLDSETGGVEYIPRKLDLPSTKVLAEHGFESAWVTPLLVEGQNYGMLTVAKYAHGAFPAEHIEFLKVAATLLAKAVRQDLELGRARRNEARAKAASELILALQAREPFDSIFRRIPALLEDALDADYVGLIVDKGEGFVVGGETPAGVHSGAPPSEEGTRYIRELAAKYDFAQFRPSGGWDQALLDAGYRRVACAFLHGEGDLRGILMLGRYNGRKYNADEQQFIGLLTSILSQSLANQYRIARTEAEAARARTLNEVALLVNEGEPIEAIFERLVDLLDGALDVDYLGLLQVTDSADRFVMVGSRPEVVRPAGTVVSSEEMALAEILDLGRTTSQYRVANHGDLTQFARIMTGMGMRRAATVLVRRAGETLGVLTLARKAEARFNPEEEAFLETVSAMLGQAIANRRRLEEARRDADRNGLLNELAILLNEGESANAFFQSLSARLKTVVPFDTLVLLAAGEQPGMLRVVDSLRRQWFIPGQLIPLETFGSDVLNQLAAGEIVVEGGTASRATPLEDQADAKGVLHGAIAAIKHGSENVGFFLLGRTDPIPFTPEQRAFLELVCVLVGQAIANRRKVEEKEAEAIRSRVLSELALILQGAERIGVHFDSLSKTVLEAVGFDFLSITTRDPATGGYQFIRSHDLVIDGERVGFDASSFETVLRHGTSSRQYRTEGLTRPMPVGLHRAGFVRAATAVITGPDGTEGLMTIGRREDNPFSEQEMAFIELVAALIGQASANYQKAYARDADALRSKVLGELAVLLNNGQPIAAHFERLRELVAEGAGFDFCSIAVREPTGETFRVLRSETLTGNASETAPVSAEAISSILATGGFSGQYGPEAASAGAPAGLFNIGIRRAASFVLTTGALPEGLLTIGRRAEAPFSGAEMAFFEVVASLLAYAAAAERRLTRTTEEAEDQAALAHAASAVARETGALAIIRSLRTAASSFIPSPFVSFGYLSDGQLRFTGGDGSEVWLPIGTHFQHALELGQRTVDPDEVGGGTAESAVEVDRLSLQSHVLTRAQSGGTTVGVLVLGSRDPSFRPSPREERLCRLIADILGPAMANARAAERDRADAADQAIVAEAAGMVARGVDPVGLGQHLREAIGKFVPDPFIRFGYYEGENVVFRTGNGHPDIQKLGRYYREALTTGQAVVPPTEVRAAAGEILTRTRRARLESHVLTRADSAGVIVGFLLIGSRDSSFAPGPRSLGLCKKIADIVGPAMANARAAERERAEAEEQAIIAEAAAAVAREPEPLQMVRSLQVAVRLFIPEPFVSFGYITASGLRFRDRDNGPVVLPIGPQMAEAIETGQRLVLAEEAGLGLPEFTDQLERTGLKGHVITLAQSASAPVGVLVVGSRNPDFVPGPREARICRLIADIVGPAMAHALTTESEREEAEDQAIVAAAASAVAREVNPLSIVRALREAAHRFIPRPFVNFGYLEGETVVFPAKDGSPRALKFGPRFSEALANGQAIVPATGKRTNEWQDEPRRVGIEAHVATRADSGGSAVGLLVVGSRDPAFDPGERELRLCRMIADIVGPAMANSRALERERQEAEDQAITAEAASAVARETTPLAIVRGLRAAVSRFIPSPFVNFGYLEGDAVRFPSKTGVLGLMAIDSHFRRALDDGQTTVESTSSRIAAGEARLEAMAQIGIEGHVLTRASSAGEVTGLLVVGSRRRDFIPGDRELRLCRLIADIIGPAMANARAIERERIEAAEQKVVAEVAAVAARVAEPGAMVAEMQRPLGGLVPKPVLAFGYLEGDEVVFPRPDGSMARVPVDEQARRTEELGQVAWPEVPEALMSNEDTRGLGIRAVSSTAVSSGGATVGFLIIGSRLEGYAFGERELSVIGLIAKIVGPAMENARATLRARLDAEEQRFLAEAAAAVAAAKDHAGLSGSLLLPFQRFIPDAEVLLFSKDPDGAIVGPTGRFVMGAQVSRTFETGQLVGSIADPDLSDAAREGLVQGGYRRWVNTAAVSGGEAVGLLVVSTRNPDYTFGERDIRFCKLVADFAGPALANLREGRRREQEAQEQRILAEAAAAVAKSTAEDELVASLRPPIQALIPEGDLLFFYVDRDSATMPGDGGPVPVGREAQRALEVGQSTVELEGSGLSEERIEALRAEGVVRWVYTTATSGGDTLGLFMVFTRDTEYHFSDRDRRLFKLIAGFAGPALANLRESARREKEAEEQRILARAAAAVATSATEADLIQGLQEPIAELIPAGRLLFYYQDGDSLRNPVTGERHGAGPQTRAALESGQATGETASPDVTPENRAYLEREGISRWVYTTATSGGDTLGLFLVATSMADYHFTERDLRLFRLIADFAGPALANLRESERRQQEAEEQRILAEAAAALAAGVSEVEILNGLVAPIRSFVPRARVAFSYVEGDEMMLWDGRNRRPVHELSRQALETGQVTGDVNTSPMTKASRDLIASAGVVRFADTTATSGGVAIGLLFVGTPVPDFEFSDRDKRMLRMIADFAGPAMVNARDERRRRDEAEDERILSEIAAVAARASTSADIIENLAEALSPLIPAPFAVFGVIEGDSVNYQLTRESDRALIGAHELTLPMSKVGLAARETGQATGHMDAPPGASYTALGLQDYVLTCHYSAGAPVGVLFVSTSEASFRFGERELALLKRVLQVVGPAIESARAEAELARQSELYSLMLRSLSEGVVLSDLEGRVVFANQLGRQILKALDPAGTATSWSEITHRLPQETQEGYRAVYEQGIGSRGRTSFEINGATVWFDYELVPLRDPVMKMLMVAADVTADVEREAEQTRHRGQMEQAQRLAALGELIGGVAHELNNPLTAILGFAEVMALSPAASELSEELSIVQKEALRARNIVRDLLFIARPGTTERAVISVSELVAHIERLRRAAWAQAGISWTIEIAQPCMVWGNEHQLTQVILNLVTNAEHALAGREGKRIVIRAACVEDRTEISVMDTGAGMDEATRNRVFEPFFTTKQGLGTGLGLPLSYSIIQSHNGEIRVESAPGAGTTFTLLLPSAPEQSASPAEPGRAAANGIVRVLVVDDEPSLRKVCQRLIASMGHECMAAENSAAAIDLASRNDFDLVLCDYRLASETANDVVLGLERVAPHLIPRMVIATGATTDAGVVELTEKYGLPLMAKPYGVEELSAMIHRAGARSAA